MLIMPRGAVSSVSMRPFTVAALPVSLLVMSLLFILTLQGTVGQLLQTTDCTLLLDWPQLSTAAGLDSCLSDVDCDTLNGITCNDDGQVTQVSLSNNIITGSLPPTWSALTSLTHLYFLSNNINGSLPPTWSALTNLTWLWLTDNNITGSLPPTWSALTSLKNLDLANNNITGSLPPTWRALTNLTWLDLSDNNITGSLPPTWGALTSLIELNLGGTQVCGVVPNKLQKVETLNLPKCPTPAETRATPPPPVPTPNPPQPVPAPSPPPPVPTPNSPPPVPAPRPPPAPAHLLVGIIVGVAAVVLAIAGITYWWMCVGRKKGSTKTGNQATSSHVHPQAAQLVKDGFSLP